MLPNIPPSFPVLRAAVLLFLLAWAGATWRRVHSPRQPPVPAPAEPPVGWVTGGTDGLPLQMPTTPFEGQRKPPCGRSEYAINGGCWMQVVPADGVCGGYMHKAACYMPVLMAAKKPPVSSQ